MVDERALCRREAKAFVERLSKLSALDPKVTMLRRMYLGTAHGRVMD